MVEPFTAIYSCEESLLVLPIFAKYLSHSARAHWEKSNGSVTRSEKCSLGGVPAIGTCP